MRKSAQQQRPLEAAMPEHEPHPVGPKPYRDSRRASNTEHEADIRSHHRAVHTTLLTIIAAQRLCLVQLWLGIFMGLLFVFYLYIVLYNILRS